MRLLAVMLAMLVFAVSRTTPVTGNDTPAVRSTQVRTAEAQLGSIDSVEQFLLTSAATDFHAHRPSDPGRFRDVRMGHIMTPAGEPRYMLCGQCLAVQEGGSVEWMPFVTIKTSGYEQMLGRQAADYCQDSSMIWDREGDLSSLLQSRLETLR